MPIAVEILVSVLLVLGSLLALIGSFGLLKLRDFYMRLHGPTKASTLGLGGILVGSSLFFSVTGHVTLHEVLITVFLFLTAPVSAHVLAKTALHKRLAYAGGQPDPMDHPLNVGVAPAFPDPEDDPTQRPSERAHVAAAGVPASLAKKARRGSTKSRR